MTVDLERLVSEPFARIDVAAVRGEEAPTLADWFRRFAPYVARIGYRLLGRDEEVDDLVQDVFLAAHRGLGELEHEGAVRAWLMTVAVRTARKRLRRRRVLAWLQLDRGGEAALAVREVAVERIELARVQAALDALAVDARIAWVLHCVEGERLEEVARVVGCSLATVKRRIKAAQEALRAVVVVDGGGEE